MVCYNKENISDIEMPTEEEELRNYHSYKRGKYTIVVKASSTMKGQRIEGCSIVFTGRGPYTRSKLMDMAKKCGAYISSGSLTKETDILVVGEKPGYKLEKAKLYGTNIMSMNEFLSEVDSIVGERH